MPTLEQISHSYAQVLDLAEEVAENDFRCSCAQRSVCLQVFLPVPLLVLRVPLPLQRPVQLARPRHLLALHSGVYSEILHSIEVNTGGLDCVQVPSFARRKVFGLRMCGGNYRGGHPPVLRGQNNLCSLRSPVVCKTLTKCGLWDEIHLRAQCMKPWLNAERFC